MAESRPEWRVGLETDTGRRHGPGCIPVFMVLVWGGSSHSSQSEVLDLTALKTRGQSLEQTQLPKMEGRGSSRKERARKVKTSILCRILCSQFSHSVMSDSLRPHELQYTRPSCPSPAPRVYSNSCPSSRWCHPAISTSVIPFSSCPQSFPASGSFPMSQLFTSSGQSIGVSASASVLPMNT